MQPILALPPEALALGLRIRHADENDLPFLKEVYVQGRWQELEQVADWTDEMKRSFLETQADYQHNHYTMAFKDVDYGVIEREADGEKAGRLYLARRSYEIRIVDIAMMPEWRNRGLGGAIIRALIEEGRAAKLPVTIHVEKNNPALRLYERLGFVPIKDKEVYLLMEWRTDDIPSIANLKGI